MAKDKKLDEMDMDEFADARNGKTFKKLERIEIEPAENGFVMEVRKRPAKKAKGNTCEVWEPPERKVFESVDSLVAAIKAELESDK